MTPADLIRLVMALLSERGLSPFIRVRDLRTAHDAAGALLRCMGVNPTDGDPVFVRIEEDDQ